MSLRPLAVQLLGDFQIRVGERVIPNDAWKLRKAAGIVKLLALEPTHRLHREQILDILWPDLDPSAAANNFRYVLHSARTTLAIDGILRREGQLLVLANPGDVDVDVHAFESAADAAWQENDPAAYRLAAEIYRGDLLPFDAYEEWLDTRRTALRTSYLALLARLARICEERGDATGAIEAWHRIASSDPVHEEAHSRLMLLYAQSGRRDEALERYKMLVANLERELGVEPEPVTSQLADAIRDGSLGQPSPVLSPARRIRSKVPAQTTSFVGRNREIGELQHLLGSSRLVTITGPGGAGKTRMAIAVAGEDHVRFPDGVFFVDLVPVSRPELVTATIVQALGLQEVTGQAPLERLSEYIANQAMLLVLDNVEHVIAAATQVQQILQACPRATILATSRIPLRIGGEQVYPLRSLSSEASTSLFIERSRDAHYDRPPDAQHTQIISRICERLDGLPLAIELAASRSMVLPPQALLDRLDRPLGILAGSQRDLPDRHRSLRSAINWSYELLSPEERSMFTRLAVCTGGCSLETIEAISPQECDVVACLAALVDSSLIEVDSTRADEPRFRMLQTIRDFGLEQIGSDETARSDHARYFATLVQSAPLFLRGPSLPDWLDRLEREHANIQTALDWHAGHDVTSGMRMVAVLWRFWWTRGHLSIGRRYTEQFLAMVDETTERSLLVQVLIATGVMAQYDQSLDMSRAGALHQQALSIWMDLDDPPEGVYWCHFGLGLIAIQKGDLTGAENWFQQALEYTTHHNQPYGRCGAFLLLGNVTGMQMQEDRCEAYVRQSLAIARSLDDPWLISMCTNNLGGLLMRAGRLHEARTILSESINIDRRLRHWRDLALGLCGIGEIDLYEQDVPSASERFAEGLTMATRAGDMPAISSANLGLAKVAAQEGRLADARDLARKSLQGFLATGEPTGIVESLEQTARVHAAECKPEEATSLFAAAARYREQVGTPPGYLSNVNINVNLNQLRETLGEAAYGRAWSAGWEMPEGQVWALAGVDRVKADSMLVNPLAPVENGSTGGPS